MSLFNISVPTGEQWKKVATAILFSFASTFLAIVTTAGGIQGTYEATVTLVLSALVAGVNAALYTLYITFFKKS